MLVPREEPSLAKVEGGGNPGSQVPSNRGETCSSKGHQEESFKPSCQCCHPLEGPLVLLLDFSGKTREAQGDREEFSPYPASLGLSCPLTSEEPSRTGPCVCEEGRTNEAISDLSAPAPA